MGYFIVIPLSKNTPFNAFSTASEALLNVKRIINDNSIKERNERNDIRKMENLNRGRKAERSGRGASGYSGGTAAKQHSISSNGESERRTGLGSNSESRRSGKQDVVSGIQDSGTGRSDDLVQVQSSERNLQHESVRNRADNRGRTDRNIRSEVDEVDGGKLSGESDRNEVLSQIPDNSQSGGQQSLGTQRAAGQAVREGESTSGEFRGSADMGTNKSIYSGQHSDERNSLSSGNETVIKFDTYINPATNSAGGFVVYEEECDMIGVDKTELSFADQVDAVMNGNFPSYSALEVCDTPKILEDIGCEKLPMLYAQKHLKNALASKDKKSISMV